MKSVCVLICTYNRRECLKVLINALHNQSYKISGIVIVDNYSSDNTIEMINDFGFDFDIAQECMIQKGKLNDISLYYYRNNANVGGAGGFKKAFEVASTLNYDFYWVMDLSLIHI